jgi:predicted short-subunit dehydrogenase-like oxidoreductase (DUF2520 family)
VPGLLAAGQRILLWSRSRAHARRLERRTSSRRLEVVLELDELASAATVLSCVRDDAVTEVARRLSKARTEATGRVALHTSGFLDHGALACLAEVGWETGSMHPLVSLPAGVPASPSLPPSMDGVLFAVEGTSRARREATRLARSLGGKPCVLASEDKAAYHAAAALLAGGVATLFDASEEILAGSIGRRALRAGLARLAASVIENAAARGGAAALSGPAARGDGEVLAGHLELLDGAHPEEGALYRLLVERMLRMAVDSGRLDEGERRRLRRRLMPPRGS